MVTLGPTIWCIRLVSTLERHNPGESERQRVDQNKFCARQQSCRSTLSYATLCSARSRKKSQCQSTLSPLLFTNSSIYNSAIRLLVNNENKRNIRWNRYEWMIGVVVTAAHTRTTTGVSLKNRYATFIDVTCLRSGALKIWNDAMARTVKQTDWIEVSDGNIVHVDRVHTLTHRTRHYWNK